MGGIEIERMLRMIDANVETNRKALHVEILRYLSEHGQDVVQQLLTQGEASIPTSTGNVTIPMSALQATTV